jgi:N-acylglucosamine-6-phosphate 2-epimerase
MSAQPRSSRGATVLERLRGKLVVSCQAPPGHPLADLNLIVALCRCAAEGGAAGLRVDGTDGVQAVRAAVDLPVIGLRKTWDGVHRLSGGRPAITPALGDAVALAAAGADIVALEATSELHQEHAAEHVEAVRREIVTPVMADVSTLDEGLAAYNAGADLVATTLSGYTSTSAVREGPDFALIGALVGNGVPTVAEGGITSPEQALAALEAGACFVVVGKGITDPMALTAQFVRVLTAREHKE